MGAREKPVLLCDCDPKSAFTFDRVEDAWGPPATVHYAVKLTDVIEKEKTTGIRERGSQRGNAFLPAAHCGASQQRPSRYLQSRQVRGIDAESLLW